MAQSIRDTALALSPGERLALAVELIDSVEGPSDPTWEEAWSRELDRRVRDLDSGAVEPIPFGSVRAELIARLRTVREEFLAAAEWYQTRSDGLGFVFLGWLETLLEHVQETPPPSPVWPVDSRFRRAVADGFPYSVFFRETSDAIQVIAVAHGARAPGYWLVRRSPG